ncbi:hypothetical protein [uncultured Jatrophihabitans sp.]|uniref:hypothetical protein n=1 Tax=uncultured Jatrophihabitans sp. TaxID=1610747 RepID=UPI0035CA3C56
MTEADETWFQVVRVDFEGTADTLGAFHQWYDEVHIPAMTAAPGIRSCSRFVDVNSPSALLAIWEIDHPSAYEHPAAVAGAGWGQFAPNVAGCTVTYTKQVGTVRRFGTAAAS